MILLFVCRIFEHGDGRYRYDSRCECSSRGNVTSGGDEVTFSCRLLGHVLRCYMKQICIFVPSISSDREASFAWILHVASTTIF